MPLVAFYIRCMDHANSSAPRIFEIDVSRQARALAILRLTDYVLVVLCGMGSLGLLSQVLAGSVGTDALSFVFSAVVCGLLAFAAYTGWRHVGVIDAKVWRSYLWLFPMLALAGCLLAAAVLAAVDWSSLTPQAMESVGAILAWGWIVAVALPAFVCVIVLRRSRIVQLGLTLGDMLAKVDARCGASAAWRGSTRAAAGRSASPAPPCSSA